MSVIGRRPCSSEPPTLTTPLRVVKVRPRRNVTTRFGFAYRWFGPGAGSDGKIVIQKPVSPARKRDAEVGSKAKRLRVQRLKQ